MPFCGSSGDVAKKCLVCGGPGVSRTVVEVKNHFDLIQLGQKPHHHVKEAVNWSRLVPSRHARCAFSRLCYNGHGLLYKTFVSPEFAELRIFHSVPAVIQFRILDMFE